MESLYNNVRFDELVAAHELQLHPRNPKTHPDEQVSALMAFIEYSGWRHPVVVSRLSGYVVAGACRVAAALRHGWDVPVVYQDFEAEQDEIAFLLADNRLPELAGYDQALIEDDLSIFDDTFDKSIIGFPDSLADPAGTREKVPVKPYAEIAMTATGPIANYAAALEAAKILQDNGFEVDLAGRGDGQQIF